MQRSPTAAGNGHWQRIQRPINPAHREPRRGAAVRVERLVDRPILSLFPPRLRLLHAHGYGTERMRQKLFVAGLGVLVKTSAPKELAGLVACGSQLAGARVKVRSSA
jgi:hypothetical protein